MHYLLSLTLIIAQLYSLTLISVFLIWFHYSHIKQLLSYPHEAEYTPFQTQSKLGIKIADFVGNGIPAARLEGRNSADYAMAADNIIL